MISTESATGSNIVGWEDSMHLKTPRRHPAFTLIEVLVVISIISLLIGLLLPAVQATRETANRIACANNLKQIGLASLNYADVHDQTLPPSYVREKGASWMVMIMPFLEQDTLYDHWDMSKTYYQQSDQVRLHPLKLYFCPSRRFASDGLASISGDVETIIVQSDCGPVSVPGNGPNVPGALADYAGNVG